MDESDVLYDDPSSRAKVKNNYGLVNGINVDSGIVGD